MPPAPQRQLNITSVNPVFTGTNKNGEEFTIYEVGARDPQTGIEVNQELRSFSNLPLGSGMYEISPYERPGKPTTYTLSVPRAQRAAQSSRKLDEAIGRIDLLEQNVAALQNMVSGLAARLGAAPGAQAAPAPQAPLVGPPAPHAGPVPPLVPAPAQTPPPFGGDDDIPF